jgi:formate dehydrogenase major subunit
MVEQACGVPRERFEEVCRAWTENSGRERTTALVYAVGWTQHSVGVQYIRTGAIIQLLLGNIGRPGGGIMAMRGHANIQGATDIPTLFNLLPGYLPMPHHAQHATFRNWVDSIRHPGQKGFWSNAEAYAASLLKAYWGDAATAENDYCYDYLPRMTGDHGTYRQVLDMIDGKIKGYFLVGENPAVGSAHGKAQRLGMANLDWLVVRDLFLIERDVLEGLARGRHRRDHAQRVPYRGVLPASGLACGEGGHLHPDPAHAAMAREGPRTARRQPLRPGVLLPSGADHPGEAGRLGRPKGPADPGPDLELPGADGTDEPSAEAVLREINGFEVATGRPLSGYTELKDDGSTACGCWVYSGVLADGVNQAARRKPGSQQSWVAGEWGWAWPANRRILYNRASADPQGRPWSRRKAYVWWDAETREWVGHDVPDFEKAKPPEYRPPPEATGTVALAGDDPFIMQGDGKGWLYVPAGLVDGPLPTHYEPAGGVAGPEPAVRPAG